MAQQRYTDEDRAAVLAVLRANDMNVRKTAREAMVRGKRVPASTIAMWRDQPDRAAPAELREGAVRDLATEVDRVRWLYLERATETGAIKSTSGYYAIKAFGDLTQAHQLLTGGPTQRIEATPWGQYLIAIREHREALPVIDVPAIPATAEKAPGLALVLEQEPVRSVRLRTHQEEPATASSGEGDHA